MVKKEVKKPKQRKENNLLKPRKIKIKIVGVGGGASSILNEMSHSLKGVSFLIADTDHRSFRRVPYSVKTFKFGEELTRGWGTGMNTEIGEKAAQASKEKIKKLFEGFDLVILVSCLGGGVSSGASPVFSQELKELKRLSLGIFTLPFSFEGEKKLRIAKESLEKMKDNLSGVIVMPNEYILKLSDKKTSLRKSLSLMNKILIDYLKDLIEMISSPGIINIDFADLKTILKGKNQVCLFGRGLAQGANRVEEALKEIFENPFFIKPKRIKKILFNVAGGESLTLRDVEAVATEISKLNPRAKIIFGISKDPQLGKKIRVTLLGIGDNFLEKESSEEKREKEKQKGVVSKKESGKKREKKKESSSSSKTQKTGRKSKVRRTALEVKKAEKIEEEKEWWQEPDWEIPAFLRNKTE